MKTTWEFNHPNDMFYFQDESEDNGIHVPFTIGLQTPPQSQAMVSLDDNGATSMDAIFSANDVKFHLFTLIVATHFEASVRMKLTLPKVGTWSPSGLPKLQSSIAKVKTPHLEVFFILLERC